MGDEKTIRSGRVLGTGAFGDLDNPEIPSAPEEDPGIVEATQLHDKADERDLRRLARENDKEEQK